MAASAGAVIAGLPAPAVGALKADECSVNVKHFGAKGDGSNETAAFQRAIDELRNGGVICVPPGTYHVGEVRLRSRQTLLGSGWATVLVREPTAGVTLRVANVSQVRIANLAIDCRADQNFVTCIAVHHAEDVTIEGCALFNSLPPGDPTWTLHAVLAFVVRGLRVEANRTEGTQIKASAAGGAGPGVFILRNRIRNPHNLGISYVLDHDTDVLGAATISGNIIEAPGGQGGIFVGSDLNTDLRGTSEEIIIADNIVTGDWVVPNCTGILARLCRVTRSWLIRGNLIRCASVPPPNSFGINVQAFPSAVVDRLAVMDNQVENVDQQGIVINGGLKSTIVSGNTVVGTRGIQIASTGPLPQPASRVTVADNHVTGALFGITLLAHFQDLVCDVHDNMVWDLVGADSRAIRVISNGQAVVADVHDNRCTGAVYGVVEEGTGTFATEYAHNKLAGTTIPLQVNPGAILHENRT